MGTLTIKAPTVVFSLTPNNRSNGVTAGFYNPISGLSTDAALLAGLAGNLGTNYISAKFARNSGVITVAIDFKWLSTDLVFSLDGGPYIASTSLPSGFLMNVTLTSELNRTTCQVGADFGTSWRATLYNTLLQGSTVDTSAILNGFGYLVIPGLVVPDTNVYINVSQFLLSHLIYSALVDTGSCGVSATIDQGFFLHSFVLSGTYTTFLNSWTVTAANPSYVGNRITLLSNSLGSQTLPSFEHVNRITFSYPTTNSSGDPIIRSIEVYKNAAALSSALSSAAGIAGGQSSGHGGGYPVRYVNNPSVSTAIRPEEFIVDYGPYIIYWDFYTITLILPWGFEDYAGDVTIDAEVEDPDETQFSGSVPLGTLTIAFADSSGMYTIIPNKHNDTLYDPARDGETVDVVIPPAVAKTGFIGG